MLHLFLSFYFLLIVRSESCHNFILVAEVEVQIRVDPSSHRKKEEANYKYIHTQKHT